MKIEPLQLHHKEILEERFQKLSLNISEYSFANVYLFREVHAFEVVIDFDLFIKGKTRDGFSYLMPTSPIAPLVEKLSAVMTDAKVDFIYPIPEIWLPYFSKEDYSITYHESESDYIYEIEKFRTYPGRHLAGRRNLVKQFLNTCTPSSHPLTMERRHEAQIVLDTWEKSAQLRNSANGDVNELQTAGESDYRACSEALSLIDVLGLEGRLFYDGDTPIGFIIGESLNNKMFVEHFAKASPSYKGIYQYMYQQFALELNDHFYYVNMEQDLGDIGLRRSKSAYMPDTFEKKYRIAKK